MLRPLYFGSTIGAFLVVACTAVNAQEETQTFDSAESAEAAGWIVNEEGQNPERDCPDLDCETDLGWKDSNAAGGDAAGEGGGQVHRSGGLPIGFYGDTTIGELTLDMPIIARGKVALVDEDFDGHAHFGFFDGTRLLEDPFDYGAELGFLIAEPGGDVAPNFRWGHNFQSDGGIDNRSNTAFLDGIPDSESLDFVIDYDPEGGDGFGLMTLVIGEDEPFEFFLTEDERSDGATFTAFGVHTGPHLGSSDQRKMEIFIDDVTYTSLAAPVLPGDYNGNDELDAEDIDILSDAVLAMSTDPKFDLNGDGSVTDADRTTWVKDEEFKHTWFGDANLDREFNTADLVAVFQAGQYEDTVEGNSTWATGDWSGNKEFNSGDLVVAFQDGGFEMGQPGNAAVAAVPEPSSLIMLLGGVCLAVLRRRTQR